LSAVSRYPCKGAILGEGHARRHSAGSCAKMAKPIKVLFGLWTSVGPRKHVHGIWASRSPTQRSNFRRKNMPWRARQHSLVSRAKVAQSIELRI